MNLSNLMMTREIRQIFLQSLLGISIAKFLREFELVISGITLNFLEKSLHKPSLEVRDDNSA